MLLELKVLELTLDTVLVDDDEIDEVELELEVEREDEADDADEVDDDVEDELDDTSSSLRPMTKMSATISPPFAPIRTVCSEASVMSNASVSAM